MSNSQRKCALVFVQAHVVVGIHELTIPSVNQELLWLVVGQSSCMPPPAHRPPTVPPFCIFDDQSCVSIQLHVVATAKRDSELVILDYGLVLGEFMYRPIPRNVYMYVHVRTYMCVCFLDVEVACESLIIVTIHVNYGHVFPISLCV
jgi:hypothetical protein